MELIFASIVIGIFLLAAVWLKHYLDERSKHIRTASSTEKKSSIFIHSRSTFLVQGVAIVLALAFCLYDVESVVISGPIVSLIGFVFAWLAHRSKFKIGVLIGLSAPTISLLCLLLIVGLDWNPDDAQLPISAIIAVYAAVMLIVAYTCLNSKKRNCPNKANSADAKSRAAD